MFCLLLVSIRLRFFNLKQEFWTRKHLMFCFVLHLFFCIYSYYYSISDMSWPSGRYLRVALSSYHRKVKLLVAHIVFLWFQTVTMLQLLYFRNSMEIMEKTLVHPHTNVTGFFNSDPVNVHALCILTSIYMNENGTWCYSNYFLRAALWFSSSSFWEGSS